MRAKAQAWELGQPVYREREIKVSWSLRSCCKKSCRPSPSSMMLARSKALRKATRKREKGQRREIDRGTCYLPCSARRKRQGSGWGILQLDCLLYWSRLPQAQRHPLCIVMYYQQAHHVWKAFPTTEVHFDFIVAMLPPHFLANGMPIPPQSLILRDTIRDQTNF